MGKVMFNNENDIIINELSQVSNNLCIEDVIEKWNSYNHITQKSIIYLMVNNNDFEKTLLRYIISKKYTNQHYLHKNANEILNQLFNIDMKIYDILLNLLNVSNIENILYAINVLVKINNSNIKSFMWDLIISPNKFYRIIAASVLVQQDELYLQSNLEDGLYDNTDWRISDIACYNLIKIENNKVIPFIVRKLKKLRADIRLNRIIIIAEIGGKVANEILISFIDDHNQKIRIACISELGILKYSDSVDILIHHFNIERNKYIKTKIIDSLSDISNEHSINHIISLINTQLNAYFGTGVIDVSYNANNYLFSFNNVFFMD